MQPFSKRQLSLLIAAVSLYSAIFTGLALLFTRIPSTISPIPPQSLFIWKIVAILVSLYTVIRAWFWPKRILSRIISAPPAAAQLTSRRGNPVMGVLLICYVLLVSPNLYGFVLVLWGLPIVQYSIFAAISILGAILWAAYQLRQQPDGSASRLA